MKNIMLVLALAATCAAPLHAQTNTVGPGMGPQMNGTGPLAMGGFVGARVRISLGGTKSEDQKLRAGLTIAPIQYRGDGDLQTFRSRIGEGIEFGFRGGDAAPQWSLAGMQLTGGKAVPGKGRSNLSDGATIALVVVAVVAVAGVALYAAADEADDV